MKKQIPIQSGFGEESMPGLFSLKGKVGIVTGGNGGIGKGIACGFAAAGADLVIAARNEAKTAGAAREIQEKFGVRVLGVQVDVRIKGVRYFLSCGTSSPGTSSRCSPRMSGELQSFRRGRILRYRRASRHQTLLLQRSSATPNS